MDRRTFLNWSSKLTLGMLGLMSNGCEMTRATGETTTPDASGLNPPQTPPDILNTTTLHASAQRGMIWLMQKAPEIDERMRHLRVWSALAFHLCGKPALAEQEWRVAWEGRGHSENERVTLAFLYLLAGTLPMASVPEGLTAAYINAKNSDGNYIVDDHFAALIDQRSPELLRTIRTTGLSDVRNGPVNLSVESMITFLALLFKKKELTSADIQSTHEWAQRVVNEAKASLLVERAFLLGILAQGDGGAKYEREIRILGSAMESAQRADGSWIEPTTNNQAIPATLLATATAVIGLTLASR